MVISIDLNVESMLTKTMSHEHKQMEERTMRKDMVLLSELRFYVVKGNDKNSNEQRKQSLTKKKQFI